MEDIRINYIHILIFSCCALLYSYFIVLPRLSSLSLAEISAKLLFDSRIFLDLVLHI